MTPTKPDAPGAGEVEQPIQAKIATGTVEFDPVPPPLGLGLPEDPWVHRATTMRCNTCMFFVIKKPTELGIVANAERGFIGRCRRHAPTMSGYPATFESDWCGDHKIDENKI